MKGLKTEALHTNHGNCTDRESEKLEDPASGGEVMGFGFCGFCFQVPRQVPRVKILEIYMSDSQD